MVSVPIFLALFAHSCVFAQEDNSAQLAQALVDETALSGTAVQQITGGMSGKISLDLRNIDVVDALKFLATKAGLNMITTKKVAGRISLAVQDVNVRDVFDIMLRSNELAYLKQGEIYNIMSEDEYRMLVGRKFSDMRTVKVFRLKYAIPEQAFSMLDTLKSDIGRVLVEPDSGTVLIMDTSENIAKVEEALSTLDTQNMVKVFELKYARAIDVEEQLKARLDAKKVGSIKADERSNLVVVQALPERMKEVEALVAALDEKTPEVFIDSKIIKVKFRNDKDWQFKWEGIVKVGLKYGMTYFGTTPFAVMQAAGDPFISRPDWLKLMQGDVGSYPFSGTSNANNSSVARVPGEGMHLGIVDRQRDFDLFFKYLQSIEDTQILSNPRIAVINNQEARIHVGEREAYVTTTTTTGQTTTTVSEEVTFIDVGIQLAVTPTVNKDGFIRMKIKPEISSVTGTLITPTRNQIPIIDTSTAETTVLVKDGATIVIGGLRRDEKTNTESKVPFLGDLPIVGKLFKSQQKGTDRTELLIMITPYIVQGDKLVTGDHDREIKEKAGKDYTDYGDFTAETDFKNPVEAPENMIKPYRTYETDKKKEKKG